METKKQWHRLRLSPPAKLGNEAENGPPFWQFFGVKVDVIMSLTGRPFSQVWLFAEGVLRHCNAGGGSATQARYCPNARHGHAQQQ